MGDLAGDKVGVSGGIVVCKRRHARQDADRAKAAEDKEGQATQLHKSPPSGILGDVPLDDPPGGKGVEVGGREAEEAAIHLPVVDAGGAADGLDAGGRAAHLPGRRGEGGRGPGRNAGRHLGREVQGRSPSGGLVWQGTAPYRGSVNA